MGKKLIDQTDQNTDDIKQFFVLIIYKMKISFFLRLGKFVYGHACVDKVAILDLDPLEADGGGHGPVQGVALLGLRPHTKHRAPRVCHRVELHNLGEADVLILIESSGVRNLVGVVHGESAAPAVVNIPCVTCSCP